MAFLRFKKILFLLALIMGFFGLLATVTAVSAATEKINSFNSIIRVNLDGSINVKEQIVYDFSSDEKHGLERVIPGKCMLFEALSVTDENNQPYIFHSSFDDNVFRIKVGDPNITVSGVKTYILDYQVKGAVGYFEDHDEIYWDVAGVYWPVGIEKVEAAVVLPGAINKDNVDYNCFTGPYGSKKESDCSAKINNSSAVAFAALNPLSKEESLTVAVKWPKNVVAISTSSASGSGYCEKVAAFFNDFWDYFLTIVPLLVFGVLLFYWAKYGNDIGVSKTIIAQYEPPDNLRPAVMAMVVNQKVKVQDISSTIVDLAVRGYLHIRERKNEVLFVKLKDWDLVKVKEYAGDASLKDYEKNLLDRLFFAKAEISVKSLRDRRQFPNLFKDLKRDIAEEAVNQGYFTINPDKARNRLLIPGSALLGLGYLAGEFLNIRASLWYALMASGLLGIIFSVFMPKRAQKGEEAKWVAQGFKEYIKTAERYRVKFQEQQNIFEKFLPYTMVFNLADKWAKAFNGIFQNQPPWYESSVPLANFQATIFVHSLNNSLKPLAMGFAAQNRAGFGSGFGGGGFAGGGGGGGGGGRW